ncbi:MAG TPA: hypothetical protein ENI51_00075, partial [Candidatus Atribacteria bacterium]|nr:hypothetical protein [Candidatus Atribacteria bacterium]
MTEKTDLEQLFLRKKPVHLLISLKNSKKTSYVSLLAKAIDCTYSHTVKLLSEFKKFGLVDFKKDNIPVTIEQIAGFLEVSQSQAYEEIRKWRTLGILEHVKIPQGINLIKGYMLTAST